MAGEDIPARYRCQRYRGQWSDKCLHLRMPSCNHRGPRQHPHDRREGCWRPTPSSASHHADTARYQSEDHRGGVGTQCLKVSIRDFEEFDVLDIPFIKNCEPSALKNLLPTASMGSSALTEVMTAATAEAIEIPRIVGRLRANVKRVVVFQLGIKRCLRWYRQE